MPTNPTPNPFTLIHDKIWEVLEADAQFAALVKVGNRVKYNSSTDADPIKQSVVTDDMPEVAVTFNGNIANIHETSSSSKFIITFQLIINTGDFRANEKLLAILWVIYKNIITWRTQFATLEFSGERFLKRVDCKTVAAGQSDPNRNRSIKGWTAVCDLEFEVHLTTSNIV